MGGVTFYIFNASAAERRTQT